ncbi:MAG: putative molybdenum carrier protein [Bacteroidales bacterium]|jgi:hypothetical protein|nr:putative molybdenum carrier protein [Bacteroidales bacterium]
MYLKIIAGGQTGVDSGALKFALDHHLPCGGYCPKGRKNENGKIDRTIKNVMESDGTLIIKDAHPFGKGTSDTIDLCKKYHKPLFFSGISRQKESRILFLSWLSSGQINVLNIAGNRESQSPGIEEKTYRILEFLLHPA